MRSARYLLQIVITLLIVGQATAQIKVAVGTCRPKLPMYTTISDAVADVPSGSTVLVCPGNYPEQVTITQPLTLQGLNVGGAANPTITVPTAGLVENSTAAGLAALILVQGTGPVTISDLAVDGTTSVLPSEGIEAGIAFFDSNGTVANVAVRNISGYGAYLEEADTSGAVEIRNSFFEKFNTGIAIFGTLLTANVHGNVIANNNVGIYIDNASGNVSCNFITSAGSNTEGIYDVFSPVAISGNTIEGGNLGVNSVGGTGAIASNYIHATSTGISSLGSGKPTIQNNRIINPSTAGIDLSCQPATLSSNTINDAVLAIANVPEGLALGPNSYFNVTQVVSVCP